MQVTVKRKVEVEETVEVEFPIYFRWGDTLDSGRDWETFGRITADGTKVKVTRTTDRGEVEYEVSRQQISIERGLSEYIGKDQWGLSRSATAEQFDSAYAEARADIAKWAVET